MQFALVSAVVFLAWSERRCQESITSVGVNSCGTYRPLWSSRLFHGALDTSEDVSFYALRHGRSLANEAGIIASDPTVACTEYGLSETGFQQAKAAARDILSEQKQGEFKNIQIVSSDLKRAIETAETVHGTLQKLLESDKSIVRPLETDVRLRERDFGEWEGTSDKNYPRVWEEDEIDASHTLNKVESVNSVTQRTVSCVTDWNRRMGEEIIADRGRTMVVLVAHGDVLQILQAAFSNLDGRYHRSINHLETAQLRKLG